MGYQDDKAGPKALAVRVLVCLVCSKQKTKVFFRETLMAKRGGHRLGAVHYIINNALKGPRLRNLSVQI